jgi:hypothetical protein
MICKYCGMESSTKDRCSYCGHSLAASAEVSSPPVSQQETEKSPVASPLAAAAEVPAAEVLKEPSAVDALTAPAAEEHPPIPAASAQPKTSNSAIYKPGMRKPAPAIMPKVSERAQRGPVDVKPIAEWVPWERAPVTDPARPIQMMEDTAAQTPHVSLSDPLAEHAIYMQQAKPVHLLNTDADTPDAAASTDETSAPAPVAPPMWSRIDRMNDSIEMPDLTETYLPMDVLLRSVGAVLLILVVAGALAYIGPAFSAIPLVVAQFCAAMVLPILRIVPWQDEDSDDLIYFILLTLVFGPIISLVIYAIISAMKQSANAGLMGCMIAAAAARIVVDLAIHVPVGQIVQNSMPLSHLGSHLDANLIGMILKDWSGMLALAGWYFANVFHKFDE